MENPENLCNAGVNKPDGLYRENNALMNQLLRRWLGHVHG